MTTGTSGGTAGGKYILTFQVSGTGAQQLAGITQQLMKMATTTTGGTQAIQGLINQINALGLNALRTGTKILTLEAQISLAERGLQSLQQASRWMVDQGTAVISGFMDLGKHILTAISPLENAANQMMIIGKMSRASANEIIEGVKDLVAATPFKTQELVDLNLALIMGKVNLDQWVESGGKMMTLQSEQARGHARLSKSILDLYGGTKITATSILADFAALTGNVGDRMPTFVRGIQRALSTGNTRLLMDQVNAEALQALTGSSKLSKMEGTAEDAMKRLYEYLRKYNAVGMSALASDTATGIMSNFEEIPTLIYQAIGGDPSDPNSPYSKIKYAFAGMFQSIAKIINNPEWRTNISKGLMPVIELFTVALKKLGDAAGWVLDVFARYPTLTGVATTAFVIAAAFVVLTGTITAAAATAGIFTVSIIGMRVAMQAAMPIIRGFGATLWASLTPILIMGAKILAVIALVAAAYYGIKHFINSVEPLKKFFEEMGTLWSAFWESMSNWSGDTSTISKDTAQKLKKAGLLDVFLELNKGMWGAWQVAKEVWAVFTGPLLEAAGLVANMFGVTVEKSEEGESALTSYMKIFKGFVIGGLTLLSKFAVALATINWWWTVIKIGAMMALTPIIALVHTLWDMFSQLLTVIGDIGKGLMQFAAGHYGDAFQTFMGAGKNAAGLVGIGDKDVFAGKMSAVWDAWKDQAGEMGRAQDLYDRTDKFANKPIEGETNRRVIEGMTIIPRKEPVSFDEATLQSLIESGKADPAKVNKAIESGEITVVANLIVDGEKLASTTVKHIKRSQARNLGMVPGLTFGGNG